MLALLRRLAGCVAFVASTGWLAAALWTAEPENKPAKDKPAAEKPRERQRDQADEGIPPEAGLFFRGPLASWRTQTLGGVQLWSDELCFHKWRIQRHALIGHYRLLDGENRRHARGSFEACLARLEQIKRERKLPPMQGRAVIVLHGLGGWRQTMQPLADYLEQNGQFTVFNIAYPSTRGSMADHARTLAGIIEHLDGIEEINFVAHSLGNLIVRHYLGDTTDPATGRQGDPRIKRFVMLAPPNHGAQAALALEDREFFSLLLGSAAKELGAGWAEIEPKLPTLACEFGIIAGGRGDDRGYNPLLEGDNDLLLQVETTRLAGARDFVVLPVLHQFTMLDTKVQQYSLRFLEQGYFISPDERQPIEEQPEQALPKP